MLTKVPVSSTSGVSPVPESQRDLLLIPVSRAKSLFQKLGTQVSAASVEEVVLSAVGVLVSLNVLYGVGWADRPVLTVVVYPSDSGQFRTLEHIWTCSLEFVCSKSSLSC